MKNIATSILAQIMALLTFSLISGAIGLVHNLDGFGLLNFGRAIGFMFVTFGLFGLPVLLFSTIYHTILFKK